jgi:hypothetical protein
LAEGAFRLISLVVRVEIYRAQGTVSLTGAEKGPQSSNVLKFWREVEPFLKTDRLNASERAMLMGGATAKAYGWSPKKA